MFHRDFVWQRWVGHLATLGGQMVTTGKISEKKIQFQNQILRYETK